MADAARTLLVRTLSVLAAAALLAPALSTPATWAGGTDEPAGAGGAPEFRQDVLPILQARCYGCHGPANERPKGDLRLDEATAIGDYLFAGDADDSYLFGLVHRGESDPERMPPESSGPPLSEAQIDTLRRWIDAGADFGDWQSQPNWRQAAREEARTPDFDPAAAAREIDRLIDAEFAHLGVPQPEPLSDELFLRRVYLDLAGRVPTVEETRAFLDDDTADAQAADAETKRAALVDGLLGSEAYVSRFANLWFDALRVQTKQPAGRTTDAYRWWIKQALRDNMPHDEFVRRLIGADGYQWDDPAVGYYFRDAENRLANVEATAGVFLGTDIGCAQCHDDPYDVWTRKDYHAFAAYFDSARSNLPVGRTFKHLDFREVTNQRRALMDDARKRGLKHGSRERDRASTAYEAISPLRTAVIHWQTFNPHLPDDYQYDDAEPGAVVQEAPLFGDPASFDLKAEGMRTLADWVASPRNPRFTLTIVNRLWGELFGHTLAGPLTDVRPADLCANPELVAHLTQTLVDLDYDVQAFLRLLVSTNAYRRECLPGAAAEHDGLPGVRLRRMTAEQLWDSLIAMRTENPEAGVDAPRPDESFSKRVYSAKTTDEFWALVEERIEAGRGSVAQYNERRRRLLESQRTGFSPAALKRASELTSPAPDGHLLRQFGQSDRDLIDGGWNNPTTPQALTLMNGPLLDLLLEDGSALAARLAKTSSRDDALETVWLATLSRRPTVAERALLSDRLAAVPDDELPRRVLWIVLNTRQFLFIQ